MVQPVERADARANRLRLVQAAHAVFRERGLDAEMKLIAERAGVGVGTIYRNFPTKDDLIAAIVGAVIERIMQITSEACAEPDPLMAVRRFLAGGFAVLDEYGVVFHAMMAGNLPAGCLQHFEQLDEIDDLARMIRRGIDSGVFRANLDPELTAAKLVSSFVPWDYHDLRKTRSVAEIVEAHIDLFLNGALQPPGRP